MEEDGDVADEDGEVLPSYCYGALVYMSFFVLFCLFVGLFFLFERKLNAHTKLEESTNHKKKEKNNNNNKTKIG